jgi:hypothetical protein
MKNLLKNANIRTYGTPKARAVATGQLKRFGYRSFVPFVQENMTGYGLIFAKSKPKK